MAKNEITYLAKKKKKANYERSLGDCRSLESFRKGLFPTLFFENDASESQWAVCTSVTPMVIAGRCIMWFLIKIFKQNITFGPADNDELVQQPLDIGSYSEKWKVHSNLNTDCSCQHQTSGSEKSYFHSTAPLFSHHSCSNFRSPLNPSSPLYSYLYHVSLIKPLFDQSISLSALQNWDIIYFFFFKSSTSSSLCT